MYVGIKKSMFLSFLSISILPVWVLNYFSSWLLSSSDGIVPDLKGKQLSAPPLEVEDYKEERQLQPLTECEYWKEIERYQNRLALRQFLARRGIGLGIKLKPLTVVQPIRF